MALKQRLANDLQKLLTESKKPITNNALVALLSFSFNLGISRGHLMLERLASGQTKEQVAESMLKYWHVDEPNTTRRKQLEDALKARRAREVKLFLS